MARRLPQQKFSIVDCRLNNLISVSGRAMERAARAAPVAYDGPVGAVPPARWPGSHLGRTFELYPAVRWISDCSGGGVGALRARPSEVGEWWEPELAPRACG